VPKKSSATPQAPEASGKRAYHSPLREQQRESTRQLIVEALADQVWKEGLSDFSVPKVAKRAGVAVRTVYRYFPTRDDLLTAVQEELAQKHPEPEIPDDIADLSETVPVLYAYFEENRALIEAALVAGLASEVTERQRARRRAKMQTTWGEQLSSLSDDDVRKVAAILRGIGGSAMWKILRTDARLSAEDAVEVVSWLHRTVLKGLGIEKGKRPKKINWKGR